MGVISDFVEHFRCNRDNYIKIKEEVDTLCRKKLSDQRIDFLWESRVKHPESLKKKLQDRNAKYDTEADNVNDIKDLIAGRVILTRWKDFGLVENVIEESFNLIQRSQHPKSKRNLVTLQQRFRGYDGLHFYVTRQVADVESYGNLVIEIQVMSSFMWAFSTLEHDIIYKEQHGKPPDNLRSLVELLKGTTNVQEVVMEMVDNFHLDFKSPRFQRDNAGLILREEIRETALSKKNIILRRQQNLEWTKKIISWISKADVENDHNQVRTTLGWHYKDSGQWFRPLYDRWIASSERKVFWLAGSVGTGKSSLVSNIIEWHFQNIQPRERERLAFFYCSRKKAERMTSLDVLRSLIAQLTPSNNDSSISQTIEYEYKRRERRPIEIQECSDLLARLVDEHENTTFIIDALDECDDADALLLHLRKLCGKTVKFFLSSRHQVMVDDAFPSCNKLELENCKDLTLEDMDIYVRTQIAQRENLCLGSRLLRGKDPELENRLIRVLIHHAQGMFIWAKLQLELFLGPRSRIKTPGDVIKKIDMLENGDGSQAASMLDKAYDEIYEYNTERGSESRTLVVKAFKWMLYAKRRLSITELAEAVSINDNETQDEITEDILLQICSNFILADKSRVAQFAHLSVPEYLRRREYDNVKEYSLKQAHIQIAVTCLTCLNRSQAFFLRDIRREFRTSPDDRSKPEWEDDNILGYSIVYWIDHVAAISPRNRSKPLKRLLKEFLSENKGNPRSTIMDWLNILAVVIRRVVYSHRIKLDHAISKPCNFFFAACIWGLIDMIPQASLTNDLTKVNSKGKPGLILAVEYGQYDVVALLLDKGANVNAQGGEYGNALQTACYLENENIVRLLFDKRANVNAQGGRYGNALQAACCGQNENENIVRLLLDQGANINAQHENYGNALHAACCNKYENIVRLLLDKGANVNAQGGRYGNALQVACYFGNENIVRLLLDKGANVNAQSEEHDNALQTACYCQNENIVRLLLDNGADVNAQSEEYGDALQTACHRENENIVRLLLDKGANINAQGGYYGNALQAACHSQNENENIVRLLSDKGADINVSSGEFGNALQIACYHENENIVRLLLDKGADVNAQGEQYGNALQIACLHETENILRLLLDKGAYINAQGGYYGNALQTACCGENENIVRLLFDNGADVNAQGGKYGNALQAACYCNHENIVQLLLAEKGNIITEDIYISALKEAYDRYHTNIVRMLLKAMDLRGINSGKKEFWQLDMMGDMLEGSEMDRIEDLADDS